jgi:hypothetical protein
MNRFLLHSLELEIKFVVGRETMFFWFQYRHVNTKFHNSSSNIKDQGIK